MAKNICLIASGISERNHRLQPWCYLLHVARGLAENGHTVTVLSDGDLEKNSDLEKRSEPFVRTVDGVPVHYLDSVNDPLWRTNQPLHDTVTGLDPDVVLLHVGLTSFVHQRLKPWLRSDGKVAPTLGIFSSPLYTLGDFRQIGFAKALRNRALSGIHLLGTLMPKALIRRRMARSALHALVTQTEATSQQILDRKLWPRSIHVITPGVDPEWRTPDPADVAAMRSDLGFAPQKSAQESVEQETVVVYFGSPTPLRGLHTLLAAFRIARHSDTSLKLLVLSRRHADELMSEDAQLHSLLADPELAPHVKIVSGFLAKDLLVRHIAASDIVALPFELVPSDAPLSLLEAQALGKPVVTSDLGCLPELVDVGPKFLARPADPSSLAEALVQAGEYHAQNDADFSDVVPRSWQALGYEWSELVEEIVSEL